MGFFGGFSGVLLSSFLGFSGGEVLGVFSGFFFSTVEVFGENASHAFQFPFGISGSFLGNAIVILAK